MLKRKVFLHPNVHLAAPSHFLVNPAVRSGVVPSERAHVLRSAYLAAGDGPERRRPERFAVLQIADSLNETRKGMRSKWPMTGQRLSDLPISACIWLGLVTEVCGECLARQFFAMCFMAGYRIIGSWFVFLLCASLSCSARSRIIGQIFSWKRARMDLFRSSGLGTDAKSPLASMIK